MFIRIFSILLIIIVAVCIWQYPIPYIFFVQTISDLGAHYSYTYTPDIQPVQNVPNSISMFLFSSGFIVLTVLLLWMMIIYFRNSSLYSNKLKGILMMIMAIGAIGVTIPWDSTPVWLHHAHTVGALCFAGGFGIYNFVCQRLRYIRKHEIAKTKSWWKKVDNIVDLIIAIAIFVVTVWYLISGILGALDVPRVGWLAIFSTGLAQKILFFVTILAAFLLDLDDF